MANGLPKRVVFRKPKITDKQIDLRAKAEEPPSKLKPDKRTKPLDKPKPEPVKHFEEPVLEISEEEPQEIIKTKSKRTIIVKREPVEKPQTYPTDTLIFEEPQKEQTFDEKFLDKMHIRSKITKDTKTLDKLTKPEIKPTVKSKIKTKPKRKLNPYILVSLILFVLLAVWSYKIISSYIADTLDGSLASFMYVATNVLLSIIALIWFIVEMIMEDKK